MRSGMRVGGRAVGPRGAAVAALLAALVLGACGGGDARYAAGGVSFAYPKSWHTVVPATSGPGATGGGTTSRVGLGIDAQDLAILVTNRLPAPVTAESFGKTEDSLAASLAQGARQKGATVQGPTPTSVGGMQGFSLTISNLPLEGTTVTSRLVVVLQGDTEYFLNCQATAAHADEIGSGCDRVLATFGSS